MMNAQSPAGATLPSMERPLTRKPSAPDDAEDSTTPNAAHRMALERVAGAPDVGGDLAEIRSGWMEGLFSFETFVGQDDAWDASLDDAAPDPYDQMFSFTKLVHALQAWGRDEDGEPFHWSL